MSKLPFIVALSLFIAFEYTAFFGGGEKGGMFTFDSGCWRALCF